MWSKPLIIDDSIYNNVSFGHPLSKTDFNNLVQNLEIDFSDKLYQTKTKWRSVSKS